MEAPLAGRVALVAGATRGAGRGIACMLGEAGATVYATGRSTREQGATPSRPETIQATAEMVSTRGGRRIALRVDHTMPDQVETLLARIEADEGRLDLLVNDVWGGDALTEFGTPFWKLSLENGRTLLERAVFSHVVTARHAAPLLMRTGNGLIVEITDCDSYQYRGNLFYDLVKTSVIRLAFDFARELRRHGVSAVALTPGFLRSEAMLERFGVTEASWRDAVAKDPHFAASETPFFVGRAVAALAADPAVSRMSGRVLSSWALSDEYGFADMDGSRPHWGRYAEATFGAGISRSCDDAFYDYWRGGPIDALWPDWP